MRTATRLGLIAATALGLSWIAADPVAWAQGINTCQWANDGECDEPGIGTGACTAGTDATDCAGVGLDTCRWASDGECDEPGIGTGACAAGTDTADCRPVGGLVGGKGTTGPGNDTCQWAQDGECDEPGIGTGACTAGTDATDCIGIGLNTCQWAGDGECDEPMIGTGVCAAGTDTADCRPSRPAAGVAAQPGRCPPTFQQAGGAWIDCVCEPGQMTGTVWGTMTYTDDSSICVAAVHAGAVPAGGGPVQVQAAAGCSVYSGSQRNGVTTLDFGTWDGSFFFPSVSDGRCGK